MTRFILFIALFAAGLLAQDPTSISRTASGSITAADTVCSSISCVWIVTPLDVAGASVQLSGTFAATVQFESSVGGTTYAAITSSNGGVSSATAAGVYSFNLSGARFLRARASAYTSGTVTVSISTATGTGGTSSGGPWTDNGSTVSPPAGRSVSIAVPGGTATALTPTGNTLGGHTTIDGSGQAQEVWSVIKDGTMYAHEVIDTTNQIFGVGLFNKTYLALENLPGLLDPQLRISNDTVNHQAVIQAYDSTSPTTKHALNLIANGELYLNTTNGDAVRVKAPMEPYTDNLYPLSSATKRWTDAWFSGIVHGTSWQIQANGNSFLGTIFSTTLADAGGAANSQIVQTGQSINFQTNSVYRAKVPTNGGFQVLPQTSAPTCAAVGDVGTIWFDNTTTTTVEKHCLNVSGTVQWVTK